MLAITPTRKDVARKPDMVCSSKYFKAVQTLSRKKNLNEAAANLFEAMRKLDKMKLDFIVAERTPKRGVGLAIMDRLQRASGEKRV